MVSACDKSKSRQRSNVMRRELSTAMCTQRGATLTYRETKGMKGMPEEHANRSESHHRVATRTSRSPLGSTMSARERATVDHTYRDHLHDPDESESMNSSVEVRPRKKGPRGGVTVTFPEKLHIMLRACEEEGLDHVVSWLPHGRCFLVRQKENFVDNVMPRFFHQSKMTSFQRQLNLYGFVRLTSGKDRGAYYHEKFLKSRPDLAADMARTRVKGNGMKAASSPETEPDFYAMEPCMEEKPLLSHFHKLEPPAVRSLSLISRGSQSSKSDEEEESLSTAVGETAMPTFPLLDSDPPIPAFSFAKETLPSRDYSFADVSAVVSLPSTPEKSGMKTVAFDQRDEWPESIFFTHISSVSDLYDQWKGESSTQCLGDAFSVDDEPTGLEALTCELVGLEMDI